MIGFEITLKGDTPRKDEGADTSFMSKNQLYHLVAQTYFLPPPSSRGVTREYLLQVKKNMIFRVESHTMKHFEIDLTATQQKKIGTINASYLVKKLNVLLYARSEVTLGFSHFDPPELSWLFRVTRYIDKSNLLEVFEEPVMVEPAITDRSSFMSRIHYGRKLAAEFIFRTPSVRQSKFLWEELKEVAETYRNLMHCKISHEILTNELSDIEKRGQSLEMALSDLVSKAAQTLTTLENPAIKPDMLVSGGDKFTAEMRNQLALNSRV